MADLTTTQVGAALKGLGTYRVIAAQEIALEGSADLISGALLLSLGLRETNLRNVENPTQTDKGVVQINKVYHGDWLSDQPGCKAGDLTKTPTDEWRVAPGGHSAFEPGYVPRFTPAVIYAHDMLKDGVAAAPDGLSDVQLIRFALAAYNAGLGGARKGLNAGDVDKYTTGGDYSRWVIRHRSKVHGWLHDHPNWKPS
jgi:hypothetical protein